ncbi:MAG: cobalt-precorrin 5A hydrolase [Bacillota bacterium]
MKVAVVALTGRGTGLGLKVSKVLRAAGGYEVELYTMPDLARDIDGAVPLEEPPGRAVGELFYQYRGLVMIMALGIVIRTLAPHVRDKRTDPAVVVLDEGGSFVISALSGHLGGANDLARLIARGLGSTAVITTATDVNGVPAVDVLARDLQLIPEPPDAIKKFNAALARGERVKLYTMYDLPLPQAESLSVRPWKELGEGEDGWRVMVTGQDPFAAGKKDILLRPRNLVVGVGCKRGVDSADILVEIKRTFAMARRSLLCLRALATIEARASEEGLVRASGELGVPLIGFGAPEINGAIERYGLSKSDYVMHRMGVGGVCEPAAMLACRQGRMLAPKRKCAGITLALAEEGSGWWESDPGRRT